MEIYNAYIDESGDEGIKRGSDWFILTAIIVKKEKDLELSKVIDNIKLSLEMGVQSQLHWNSVKGFPNKKMIIDTISKYDFTIINILINTKEIASLPTKKIYGFYCGYLFERITSFLNRNDKININISSRGNLKKDELLRYLKDHKDRYKINFDKILKVKIYPNSQKKLLQLADCCCSSLGQALKYNDSSHKYYVKKLSNKFYRHNNILKNHGIKIVPPGSLPESLFWLDNF